MTPDYDPALDSREPEFGGHTAFGCEMRERTWGSCDGSCSGCLCHFSNRELKASGQDP